MRLVPRLLTAAAALTFVPEDSVAAANTPTVPNMVTADGTNAPAPWPVFTRAGCDVGAIATANVVLENTGTGATGDITKVFGNPSPQFSEALTSNEALR